MKRIISFALTVFLLVCAAAIAAGAAGANPVDPVWDGMVARWKPPANAVDHYDLTLYLDGNVITSRDAYSTSCDFSDTIKNCGPGSYRYDVKAIFTNYTESSAVTSSEYTYSEPSTGSGAHPHTLKKVDYKAPTCTEKGVDEHYECPVCNGYFWNADGTDVIYNPSVLTIPAKGHDWGEWKITKQPTESAEGEEERVCQNDSAHVEKRTLPKLKATAAPSSAATTAPASSAPATTAPSSTVPKTTARVAAPVTVPKTTAPKTTASVSEARDGGNILMIVLIVVGVLLFLVVPGAIVLIMLLNRKKDDSNKPKPTEQTDDREYPAMNGSEYLPQHPNGRNDQDNQNR